MQPTNKLLLLPADGKLKPVKPAMHMQPAAFSHLADSMMPAKTALCASLGIHCNLVIAMHHMGCAPFCE